MGSCCASGAGSSIQKLGAWRNRDWLIHFFFSTSSVCMTAIWAVGPPKEIKPSFSQKRNASAKDGAICLVGGRVACSKFIGPAKTSRVRRNSQNRDVRFLRQKVPLWRNL